MVGRGRSLIIAALATVFLAVGVTAEAKMVGVIMTGDVLYYQEIHKAFLGAMKGTDVQVVLQKPEPEPMAWANAARKLVVLGADVIVAYGAPATLTAMKATTETPIVFAGVYTPEEMNVSGKNATGIGSTVSMRKVLEDLRLIKPFTRLGVVFNKSEKDTILQARDIKKLEVEMGFSTVLLSVRDDMSRDQLKQVDAIVMTSTCAGMHCVKDLVGVAREQKLVTGSTLSGAEELGIVLTVFSGAEEQGAAVADMVKQVLGGRNVADMPLMEPRVVMKIVNLREAQTLGLAVPQELLKTATRVIR
jgi:putative ABC transport system substrate-binding protein